MSLRSQRSSNPDKPGAARRAPAPAAVLEFLSPPAAVLAIPVPRFARLVIWIVGSMLAAWIAAIALIAVDRVISTTGKVVAKSATIVVQPLETSIVRSINVREGQQVRAGDLLARLDPTFAKADVSALESQVASLEAETARLQVESQTQPFTYQGSDPPWILQAAIHTQREAERTAKLESYHQKIEGLSSAVTRSAADVAAFRERLSVARSVQTMRERLEQMQAGSRLNLLVATDNRLEIERNLSLSLSAEETAKTDLAAMIAEQNAFVMNWRSQAIQALSDASRKLSDAREALSKAQLRRRLVELRADRDAIVLTVARVSEGSVLQPGEQFLTLVPTNSDMEIEATIAGRDNGFVRVGDPVAIKFDAFPFSQHGLAVGAVRTVSADSFASIDPRADSRGGAATPAGATAPFYRARISIDHVALRDVPSDFHVAPGMPVTADVRVGRRTILGYLLGRVLTTASEGMREP